MNASAAPEPHGPAPASLCAVDGTRLPTRAAERPAGPDSAVRVALVVPGSGPLGLLAPSSLNCASLAQTEINTAGGILGRPLELIRVDGGRTPAQVAGAVSGLVEAGEVDAVVGMHTSAVRVSVADAIAGTVPYVYTPPYEGGEQRTGLLCTGETLGQQIEPALAWLVANRAAKRWFLLGSDYNWPKAIHALAGRTLRRLGAQVVGEALVPLEAPSFDRAVDRLIASRADAVLLNIIGDDLVRFHRLAASADLTRRLVRLSGCLEENTLLGLGGDDSGELWTVMGFFPTLATESGLAFDARYAAAFGPRAPVTSAHAESCYEGVRTLGAVAGRARSLHPGLFDVAAEGTRVEGARGPLTISDRHVQGPAYLAHADGLDFHVVTDVATPAR